MDRALIKKLGNLLSLAKSTKKIAHLSSFLVCLAVFNSATDATDGDLMAGAQLGVIFDDTQQIVQNPALRF
jgi:hypothetical protein